MSFMGDLMKRVTGRTPEPQKPKAEPPKPTPAPVQQPVRMTPTTGQAVPSPTARMLNRMPEVKAVGEGVYNGTIPARPGPLAPTPAPVQQATRRPTENTPQPRPLGGPRPGPTVAVPGMGGAYSSQPVRPPVHPVPPLNPAPQPAARKPPVKTFDQFIGAHKPGHKL